MLYAADRVVRSNDYSSNKSSSPYKAILLNKVVVGKGYKVTENNTSLTAPPSGYDSVSAFEATEPFRAKILLRFSQRKEANSVSKIPLVSAQNIDCVF